MKHLKNIHSLPYVTTDRRIVSQGGYDEGTQIYLHLPLDYSRHVPAKPTREQLKEALAVMLRPWSGYTWSGPDDAAAMLSGVLSAVFRPALSLCPGYMFDASTQGSGKTLAATALGSLLVGRLVGVTPFAGDGAGPDDEMRKKLVAHVKALDSFICIDNVVGHWKSAALASVITSGRVVDRLLGSSQTIDATALMLITATGNNASLDADLLRRFVRSRVDSGSNPTARSFPFTPTHRALHERLDIAEAACTLLAGYWAAGAPCLAEGDAGGFADWNVLCRQPVLWAAKEGLTDVLGCGPLGDPAASLMTSAEAFDPEVEALGELLRSLHALSEGRWFTAREVQQWYRTGSDSASNESVWSRLYEAVRDLLGSKAYACEPSSRTLGRVLMNRRDRVVQGLKLSMSTGSASIRDWRVVQTG